MFRLRVPRISQQANGIYSYIHENNQFIRYFIYNERVKKEIQKLWHVKSFKAFYEDKFLEKRV